MNTDILNTILITKDDADEFIQRLDMALAESFRLRKTPDSILDKVFSVPQAEYLKKQALSKGIKLDTTKSLDGLIKQVKESLESLAIVRLVLAFDPSQSFIKKLSAVINQDSPDYRLLGFEKDTLIMGGVIIEIDGKRIDRSVRRKLKVSNYLMDPRRSLFEEELGSPRTPIRGGDDKEGGDDRRDYV